jgi:hypothetical protein
MFTVRWGWTCLSTRHMWPATPFVQNYQPQAPVGACPSPWNAEIDALLDNDILRLAVFYNDDFGVVVADPIVARKYKG